MPRLEHSYHDLAAGRWLRGNLHAHTTRSDGAHEPQALIDDFVRRGYGFLAFSDHDICTTPTDYGRLDDKGLLLIPANEITMGGPHMLHIGAEGRLEPNWRRQVVIDQANQGEGFIIMNHPNWQQHFDHCPISLLELLNGYVGVEIFNGIMQGEEGSAYALDKWDIILSSGRRVWGFANDDTHGPGFVGLGWNVAHVFSDAGQTSPAEVVDALKTGRFYASTGVRITDIQIDGMRVRVETDNAHRVVGVAQWGKRFAWADGNALECEVPADTPFVRFECWGAGEKFAWTQPMFVVE